MAEDLPERVELSINAPAELAAATQRHARSGNTVFERVATLAAVGSLNEPLRNGKLHGAHVDTVAKVLRTVRDQDAAQFNEILPTLIAKAVSGRTNPDELARTLAKAARQLENDDGVSRHEQQRRETALRTWTDKRNGMFRISGVFDLFSGALLNGRLNAAIAALFAEKTPSTCPTDPGLKQDHLRALALLSLTAGGSSPSVAATTTSSTKAAGNSASDPTEQLRSRTPMGPSKPPDRPSSAKPLSGVVPLLSRLPGHHDHPRAVTVFLDN